MMKQVEDWWAEILVLIILLLSFMVSTELGIIETILEILFNVSLGLAVVFRYFKVCLWSWPFLYILNRFIGVAMPVYGLVFTFSRHGPRTTADITCIWLFVADAIITLLSFARLARWFVPAQVRTANDEDIDDLLKIEASAFEREDHRATRDVVTKRIQTSPDTIFVLDHCVYGLVGSAYSKRCTSEEIETGKKTWYDINNDGDFSDVGKTDSLYCVGLQSLAEHKCSRATELLTIYATKNMISHNMLGAMYGGIRLPGFAKSSIDNLDEYIRSGQDPLYKRIVGEDGDYFKPKCIGGLKNYWDDPESRSCAALIKLSTPCPNMPNCLRKSLVVGVLEHLEALLQFTCSFT